MQTGASRQFLYIFVMILSGITAQAQNITKSPYSIIGLGDLQFYGTPQQSAMGQVNQGIRKVNNINVLNPASYSALKYTVLDGGIMFSQGSLTKGGVKSDIDNFSFTYFMFAVPLSIKKNIGMSFGLSPYSAVGYNVSTVKVYPDYIGTTSMVGSGGLSKLHMGFGAQVVKHFSLGVNANYLFGQLIREQRLIVPSVYAKSNLAETRRRNVSDIQFEIGAQYHLPFEKGVRKDKYEFVAGATYTVGNQLAAKETYYMRSLGVGGTTFAQDTIMYTNNKKGTIDMPFSIKGGLSYEKKDNWQLAADVNYTNWSSYQSFGLNDSLNNSLGFSLGGSFIPNILDYKNYFKRTEYRAGARYESGYIYLNGKNISSYAVSAGVGLPLGKSKSRLNITGEYIVKGTTSNNLIREEYFRITIGLNFSDRWFLRYKYE